MKVIYLTVQYLLAKAECARWVWRWVVGGSGEPSSGLEQSASPSLRIDSTSSESNFVAVISYVEMR